MKKLFTVLLTSTMLALSLSGAACSKKVDSPKLEHNIMHFYSEDKSETVFFADGNELDDRIAGAISSLSTVDGQEGFVLAGTALYRIDADGILKIYPAAVTRAVQALDGGAILFSTATQIFLYDHASGEYEQLEDIDAKSILSLTLSPDGKTAGIAVTKTDGGIASYVYSNGSTSEYGEDTCIVAIANDNSKSYYLKADGEDVTDELHFLNGSRDVKIGEGVSPYFEVNRNLSEITFDMDGCTHYSVNGSEAKKLLDTSALSFSGAQYSSMGGSACMTQLKNTNTLFNSVYYANVIAKDKDGNTYDQYDIYFVNSQKKASKLAGGAAQFSVSSDGKGVLFLVDGVIYKTSAYEPKKPKQLLNGVATFCCSDDLNEIHYIDSMGNLRLLVDGNQSVVLVSGVDYVKRMKNGVVLCYSATESNGTLIWLDGEKADAVATGVAYFEVFPNSAMYLTENDSEKNTYNLFVSTDGVNFALAEENVSIGKR